MAVITAAELQQRFPEFAEQQPAVINPIILQAERQTPASVWGNSGFRVDGIAYLSAHLLATRIVQIGSQIGAPSGAALAVGLDSTHYGQEYKRLRDSIVAIGFASFDYTSEVVDYEPTLPPPPSLLPNESRTANTATASYFGTAPGGTDESSLGWTIVRYVFNNAGVLQTRATASGSWANRASLPYS